MKKVLVIALLVSIFFLMGMGHTPAQEPQPQLQGTISISGAWALYPMVVKWAEEFRKIHPQVQIDIAAGGAGKGMMDCLSRAVDLGMVSREIYPEEVGKGAWWVTVTKDAVVPTVNSGNPALKDLLSRGLTQDTLAAIWISGETDNWGAVTGKETGELIHVYTRSDACGAAETWAKYLGKKQEDLLGVGVYGDPGLAEAVRNDTLGIGFNNINYVYDASTRQQVSGIRVLPLDLNADGQIGEDEDFYDSQDTLIKAIDEAKFPSPPARDLHLVSQGKPENAAAREFLRWILVDGQKYVTEAGYIGLPAAKVSEGLEKIGVE